MLLDSSISNAVKLVIAGPVGAGKSTAIRSISDSEPVSTEMPLSDGPMGDKTTTTVAFDFSMLTFEDDNAPLYLYGLPGQQRFKHMWPIILQGAIGLVLLLDGSVPNLEEQGQSWLASLKEIDGNLPIVIGVTKTDTIKTFNITALRRSLADEGCIFPIFSLDVRDKEQTRHLIRALLASLE